MSRITIEGWKQKIKRPESQTSGLLRSFKEQWGYIIIAEVKKASPSKGL